MWISVTSAFNYLLLHVSTKKWKIQKALCSSKNWTIEGFASTLHVDSIGFTLYLPRNYEVTSYRLRFHLYADWSSMTTSFAVMKNDGADDNESCL